MARSLTSPLIGVPTPATPGILAYDDVMLREPRLLVPRARPTSLCRIDPQHPLASRLIGWWMPIVTAQPPFSLNGKPISYYPTYSTARLSFTKNTPTGRNVQNIGTGSAFGVIPTFVGTASAASPSDTITAVACGNITSTSTDDLGLYGNTADIWSWLDLDTGILRPSAYVTYDTTNTITAANHYTIGHIWRANNTWKTFINGKENENAAVTRSNIAGDWCIFGRKYDQAPWISGTSADVSSMSWGAIWARELSSAELNSLYMDPFAALIPL